MIALLSLYFSQLRISDCPGLQLYNVLADAVLAVQWRWQVLILECDLGLR